VAAKRKAAAAPAPESGEKKKAEDEGGYMTIRIGKVKVNLSRIPELLLLLAIAAYVSSLCVKQLGVTWPGAIPMGLFIARQLQKLLQWLNSVES
ncbi:unnamed protein product, partial [Polarella glacialis]